MEMSMDEVKAALREVIQEEMGSTRCRIAPKFEGGKVIVQPFDTSLEGREMPISALFKKITSVREKLRVLEQKLNNHPSLSRADKAELQGLISRAYGSLTTFNFLFRDEEDRFVGMKGPG